MKNYRFCREGKTAIRSGKQPGFTLVELMVTLAILAILVGLAAPGMRSMIAKRTVTSQAESLGAALRLARSEAIKRGQVVTVCASADPEAKNPACLSKGAANWATGWIVFVDHLGSLGKFDADETLLKVQPAFQSAGGIVNPTTSIISFNQNGMVTPVVNSTFTVRPDLQGTTEALKESIRCVVVSSSGRARTFAASSTKGDCQP